ncbi:MAG: hypothetical protein CMD36_01065 [Flavobacteriales bacterium]|nr:hypothetical protein [Flavobacteriales bacterium]|tara:strand:- start:506 stop:2203 length:1698 start_codon:yes stop_codon:yes gene_type:complete
MYKKFYIYFCCFFLFNFSGYTQNYTSPLNIDLILSGTFGELRSNHFHAGIDLKTKGVEGLNVYSIADGYVSRVKVSSYGYGKVIYITHYDGNTSVYAHLKEFSQIIDSIVKIEQYKIKKFEIDYYLPKDAIKVKQKEIIGKSGNSGSSAGAHLHFEIRDSKTQKPINPLYFNFNIKDDIKPEIKKLKIYNLNNTNKHQTFDVIKKEKNNYFVNDTLHTNGDFGIGISTYDKSNYAYNKNGVYSIKLYVDEKLTFHFIADTLDFITTRFINAHIDYKEKIQNKIKYHRLFKLPFNKLKNYKTNINNGIISLADTNIHNLKIHVEDYNQNLSEIKLKVKNSVRKIKKNNLFNGEQIQDLVQKKFYHKHKNIFLFNNVKVFLSEYSLYEDMIFSYSLLDSIKGVYGNIHRCHKKDTPIHKKYDLYIKEDVPEKIKNKVYIAKREKENTFKFIGGKWEGLYLKTSTREFGDFCIVADSTGPIIKGVNIFPGKKINKQKNIKLTIEDSKSGIKKFEATVNNKWVLLDYDHKTKIVKYDFNEILKKGDNKFVLRVTDNCNNLTTYKAVFTL